MAILPVAFVICIGYLTLVSAQGCTDFNRTCVSAANCVDKRCVCPAGTYGEGLLDCVPDGFANCLVCADPKIDQFPNSRGALFLPCRKRLAKFVVPITGQEEFCRFTVFGTSELFPDSRLFETEVEIQLSVGSVEPEDGQSDNSFQANNSIFFRINEDGVIWTTDASGWMSNSWKWKRRDWLEDFSLVFDDVLIEGTYDSDNILTWQVPECATTVKFRPYTPGEAPQTRIPGVSITSPPRAQFNDSQCQFPNTLCATPDDDPAFLEQAADSLGLSVDQYLLFASLKNAPKQTRGDFKFECHLLCNMFKTKCTREEQILAVRTCGSLLIKRKTLGCLQDIKTKYNPLDIFQKCVQFVCLQDYSACKTMFQFTNSCPMARSLMNVDCGPALRIAK